MFFKYKRAQLARVRWDGLQQESVQFAWWWQKLNLLKLNKTNQDRIQLSVYILWILWKTRNLWVFTGEKRSEKETVDLAYAEWYEFSKVHKENHKIRTAQTPGHIQQKEKRRRNTVGCTILYISTYSLNQKHMGFGGFVVDDQGTSGGPGRWLGIRFLVQWH